MAGHPYTWRIALLSLFVSGHEGAGDHTETAEVYNCENGVQVKFLIKGITLQAPLLSGLEPWLGAVVWSRVVVHM